MIHATFEDSTTMLFDPSELVYVCEDVFGDEYIAGEKCGTARVVVEPGVFVLSKVDDDGAIPSDTRILRVREV